MEVLKQPENKPLSLGQQVTILFALNNGHLDDVDVSKILDFENAFHEYISSNHQDLLDEIQKKKDLTKEITESLESAISKFKKAGLY